MKSIDDRKDDFTFKNNKKNKTFSFVASFLNKFSLTTRLIAYIG